MVGIMTSCWCYACNQDRPLCEGFPAVLYVQSVMIVCPDCGYKRCPKATDHNLPCSGSNDIGQPGSRYLGSPECSSNG
jgi:hypothetical protein